MWRHLSRESVFPTLYLLLNIKSNKKRKNVKGSVNVHNIYYKTNHASFPIKYLESWNKKLTLLIYCSEVHVCTI